MGSFAVSSSLLKRGRGLDNTPSVSQGLLGWLTGTCTAGNKCCSKEKWDYFLWRGAVGSFLCHVSCSPSLVEGKTKRRSDIFLSYKTQDILRNCFLHMEACTEFKVTEEREVAQNKHGILRVGSHLWEPDHVGSQLRICTPTYLSYILDHFLGDQQ